jgi:hypothetical protein
LLFEVQRGCEDFFAQAERDHVCASVCPDRADDAVQGCDAFVVALLVAEVDARAWCLVGGRVRDGL